MGRPTAQHRRTARWPLRALRSLLPGCAILIASALLPAPAPAAEGKPPLIGPVSASAGFYGEGLIETQINPEGRETTYEVLADCEVPAFCQHAEGTLPADSEEHPIGLKLAELKPGITYHFDIYATSSAGAMNWPGELTAPVIPPGAHPEGLGPGTPYEAEVSKASIESAERQAAIISAEAEARRRQQAREQEEHNATEAAAIYAAEAAALKKRETEEAEEAAAADRRAPACIVPSLKGDTLSAARHALAKAHCCLGKVSRPARHHGALLVIRQTSPHGKKLPGGAPVAVTLAARIRGKVA
ncbi:MAG: hypothetical protein ACHQE6_06625 [Solirubrobacterales bacterium]